MRRLGAAVLAALALPACGDRAPESGEGAAVVVDTLPGGAVRVRNPERGAWDSAQAWQAVEAARIGTADAADPALAFARIGDLGIDSLGRVWVLEAQAKELRVFEPDGRHVRTVGREGGGPGELRNPTGLAWGPAGSVWVSDPANVRYEVFDSAGRHVRSHRRRAGGWSIPWGGGFDRAGVLFHEHDYVGAPGEERSVFVRHRLEGGELVPADTFELPLAREESFEIEFSRGRVFATVPFTPQLSWRYDGREGVWFGTGETYRLVHRSLRGDTLRVVERAHTPVPVTAAERDSTLRALGGLGGPELGARVSGGLEAGRIPRTKPAFTRFVLDDRDHLWVAATAAGSPRPRWDVFDPGGRYLGPVDLDLDLHPLPRIAGNTAVGVRRDEDGVPYVVVYRLEGRPAR